MWLGRRRRRTASLGVVAIAVTGFCALEYAKNEYQRRQEFSGIIVRKYSALEYLSRKNYQLYWDIRDSSGEIHSPRIRPKSFWETGHKGDRVIKRAGELYPIILNRA